ncbi:shikimate dehydrogenase family protein [Nocardia bovistercoris]|uniref:shikimate dehydrogenase (NADP(+)) n=1 Tax=Nocardia bovistercoris TaxID=2785916 RepID=A0A931I570_9NOCA|nr:shikimate dehydrogenase [Nocardia bovistercoris]MBH0774774.1 hypothetical protein [Nocardia bovistercoris]
MAILGDPIAQATTPALINAALARAGIDATLVPMRVPAGELAPVLDGLRKVGNFRGAVITMPHKRAVMSLLDGAEPAAARTGACNVVRCRQDGGLVGDMLDGEAMVAALLGAGHRVEGSSVVVFGAGGAAAGIASAVLDHGARNLILRNRTRENASRLRELLMSSFPAAEISVAESERLDHGPVDIAINATSMGMNRDDRMPFDLASFDRTTVIADVVNKPDTTLLTTAGALGFRRVDGTMMLSAQIDLMIAHMLADDSET